MLLITVGLLLIATGCDTSERISRLEKQNKELESKVQKEHPVAEYDLQGKCSKEAKTWFNENWRGDKDTILLTYINHYNKQQNKCFIMVDNRYHAAFLGGSGSWIKDVALWDVQENTQYGAYSETHAIHVKPESSLTITYFVVRFTVRNAKMRINSTALRIRT